MSATLTDRAIAAYYRSRTRSGAEIIGQPSSDSGVTGHDGLTYVVLRNASGTLAVYRVLGSGALKELRRWPREVAPPKGAIPVPVTLKWAERQAGKLALAAAGQDVSAYLGELVLLATPSRGTGQAHRLAPGERRRLMQRLLQSWTQDELDSAGSAALRAAAQS